MIVSVVCGSSHAMGALGITSCAGRFFECYDGDAVLSSQIHEEIHPKLRHNVQLWHMRDSIVLSDQTYYCMARDAVSELSELLL